MFYLRSAAPDDLPALREAARHLDSVNLPNDEARLEAAIDLSVRSFAGTAPPAEREWLFVLCERTDDGHERAIGSSMIFAQHGSRRAPHVFFDVIEEERYSETLDRHFHHKVLRIGYNYNGVTEIGGLVLLPPYRGHPEQLGKLLVHVRFLFIALHRDLFCDQILSELMPPLEPDGTSLLWESLGRRFTGLSYQEADRLSRENKEFIRTLFPQEPIYATLLSPQAQAKIGEVGPNSKGVERMLVRAGFEPAHRIDPFDGGPHFHARTDALTPVRATRTLVYRAGGTFTASEATAALIAPAQRAPGPFQAVRALVALRDNDVLIPPTIAQILALTPDEPVAVLPL